MPYPPAPWKATGFVIQTFYLVDVEKARPFVPKELKIVSLFGKTVGAVYVAKYGAGSALEYSELIISPAFTQHDMTFRAWISHIYVDNEDSLAGGREIWGLPKEMATFTWNEQHTAIEIRQDKRLLCRMTAHKARWSLPMLIFLPTFSSLKNQLLSFIVWIRGQLGIVSSSLEVPTESPFADLDFGDSRWTMTLQNIAFVATAPRVVASLLQDKQLHD